MFPAQYYVAYTSGCVRKVFYIVRYAFPSQKLPGVPVVVVQLLMDMRGKISEIVSAMHASVFKQALLCFNVKIPSASTCSLRCAPPRQPVAPIPMFLSAAADAFDATGNPSRCKTPPLPGGNAQGEPRNSVPHDCVCHNTPGEGQNAVLQSHPGSFTDAHGLFCFPANHTPYA